MPHLTGVVDVAQFVDQDRDAVNDEALRDWLRTALAFGIKLPHDGRTSRTRVTSGGRWTRDIDQTVELETEVDHNA